MKKFKILFIFLVLFISVSAVHADGNFTSLQTEINNAGDSIEITRDYIYDNSTDFGLKMEYLLIKRILLLMVMVILLMVPVRREYLIFKAMLRFLTLKSLTALTKKWAERFFLVFLPF